MIRSTRELLPGRMVRVFISRLTALSAQVMSRMIRGDLPRLLTVNDSLTGAAERLSERRSIAVVEVSISGALASWSGVSFLKSS